MRAGRSTYIPLPAEPIPTLTTERGYAVAVIADNGVVRGLYDHTRKRVKFDIIADNMKQMNSRDFSKFPIDYDFKHSSSIVCLIPHTHSNPWQPI